MIHNLTISAPLRLTLREVGTALGPARDPWWVIGSAAVALHGADPGQVADVDVLLATADAIRILPLIGVEVQPGSPHPDFRSSMFGKWNTPPLPVEFMAAFRHRSGGEWVRVEPATRSPIDIDGVTVFMPDRSELQQLLEAFGRPKDLERAHSLHGLPTR